MYFQNGHMSAALDELGIALSADSGYVQAYSVRGLVYANLKEYGKAENDFQRALSLSPSDPEVNNNYGWYLCDTGKERQSIAYFLQALKNPLYETPDRAYTNAGTCAMKAGDLDGAQNYLLNALRLARDGAPTARLQLAKLFFQRGIYEEARVYLNDVLKMMERAFRRSPVARCPHRAQAWQPVGRRCFRGTIAQSIPDLGRVSGIPQR